MAEKSGPKKGLIQRISRPGEGHTVDVTLVPGAKGVSPQYSLDMSGLPVPDRRLTADAVAVVRYPYLIRLVFGQSKIFGGGYLSHLAVQMTFNSVHQFLQSLEPIREGVDQLKDYPVGELSIFDSAADATAVVNASIIFAGYSGIDGCMDFYHASPFTIRSVNLGNKLTLEPIVRVYLPTPLIFAMWRRLDEMAADLPMVG